MIPGSPLEPEGLDGFGRCSPGPWQSETCGVSLILWAAALAASEAWSRGERGLGREGARTATPGREQRGQSLAVPVFDKNNLGFGRKTLTELLMKSEGGFGGEGGVFSTNAKS